MLRNVLLLSMSVLLASCASAPKPVPVSVLAVCPTLPPLELAAPDRDWQDLMQDFLRGTLSMPLD